MAVCTKCGAIINDTDTHSECTGPDVGVTWQPLKENTTSGTFTTTDGKTITVTNGQVVSIV